MIDIGLKRYRYMNEAEASRATALMVTSVLSPLSPIPTEERMEGVGRRYK